MNANSRLLGLGGSLLCLFASAAVAESSDWIEDAHGCKVANTQPQPIETITWSGHCKDGFTDGAGTVRWFSEGKFNGVTSGTFREGKLNGKGYVTIPHAPYERVVAGARNPNFRHVWPSGSRLDGEFVDNQLIGDGVLTKPNGQKVVVNQVSGILVRKSAEAPASATRVVTQ